MTRPFNPAVLRYRVSVFIDLYRKSAEIALHREATHRAVLRERDKRIRLIVDRDAPEACRQPADMIFTLEDRAKPVSVEALERTFRAVAGGRK